MIKILKPIDYLLVCSLFVTCIVGIIMMYSASSIVAVKNYGYSNDYFFRSQANIFLLGTIVFLFV